MPIKLFTLGLPRVEADGVEIGSFQRQKLRCALLTFVAVERAVSRDRAVGVFWPDRAPDAARHALSQTLYEIRQELPADPFVVDGDRIATSEHLWVDAVELENSLAAEAHRDACALYAGAFLDGAYLWRTNEWEQWVDRQRLRLAGMNLKARRRLMAELDGPDRVAEALAAARAWTEIDPLEDEAHHHLIDFLARAGQRNAALRHYDEYAAQLRRELEVDPLEQTRSLVERIRAGDHPAPAAEPAPDGTGDAGAPQRATARPGHAHAPGLDPRLEVVRLLGEGSVASVYLAREVALRRLLAVKVLSDDLADDEIARLRFEREAEAAARIHHPHVVPVYWIGRTPAGRPFITMPWIKGGSLADRLKAWGPFEVAEAVRAAAEVAAGLSAAHRLGVIHRDVRAANVLYEQESGRNLLCDFGIASVVDELSAGSLRLTRTGEWIGNPTCISPEQLLGQPVTEKTDVYGLGTLLFELLGARAPFDATTPAELTIAHVRAEPHRIRQLRPDVPERVDELIHRCLAKRPEHRPGVEDVLASLG